MAPDAARPDRLRTSDPAARAEPRTDPDPEAAPDAATDAAAQGGPLDEEAFVILQAGVLPPGAATPAPSGAIIASDDPLRVAAAYSGAAEGVTLVAWPGLPDGQARPLTVTLASRRSSHVFVWPAPPAGWVAGRHQVRLLAEGDLAALVDVTIELRP